MLIKDLIKSIKMGNDEEAHEAALSLGLLIEKRVKKLSPQESNGIKEILDDELANQNLSETEIEIAVDELIYYIEDKALKPHPMAIWALTKSCKERVVPYLTKFLYEIVEDPKQENLAYQALIGIINIGTKSVYKNSSMKAIRDASKQGHGQVVETAMSYLSLYEEGLNGER